jgi:hypothetical protein
MNVRETSKWAAFICNNHGTAPTTLDWTAGLPVVMSLWAAGRMLFRGNTLKRLLGNV